MYASQIAKASQKLVEPDFTMNRAYGRGKDSGIDLHIEEMFLFRGIINPSKFLFDKKILALIFSLEFMVHFSIKRKMAP